MNFQLRNGDLQWGEHQLLLELFVILKKHSMNLVIVFIAKPVEKWSIIWKLRSSSITLKVININWIKRDSCLHEMSEQFPMKRRWIYIIRWAETLPILMIISLSFHLKHDHSICKNLLFHNQLLIIDKNNSLVIVNSV